jgi:hypothetical protein
MLRIDILDLVKISILSNSIQAIIPEFAREITHEREFSAERMGDVCHVITGHGRRRREQETICPRRSLDKLDLSKGQFRIVDSGINESDEVDCKQKLDCLSNENEKRIVRGDLNLMARIKKASIIFDEVPQTSAMCD